MAWFRKERKPRVPRRERLEIPPDAWEKCEACAHTDIREKFIRNLNVCPQCDYHRRIRQWLDHYLKGAPAPAWITKGSAESQS